VPGFKNDFVCHGVAPLQERRLRPKQRRRLDVSEN